MVWTVVAVFFGSVLLAGADCCERKVRLAVWWLVLIWCERKILLLVASRTE